MQTDEGSKSDNSLNRKQVVSLTYLLMLLVCCLSVLAFVLNDWLLESLFHVGSALVSVAGLVVTLNGRVQLARFLFPPLCATYAIFCSFLFYGSESDFEWFLVILPVYSVTAFQIQRYKVHAWVCLLAAATFSLIDIFAPSDMLLQSEDLKLAMSFMTFLMAMVITLLITGTVVTQLGNLNAKLRDLAEIDELTKLNNRRKVLAEAVNVFADAIINNQKCCFAIIDLDHFKSINDSYGHDVGDIVLRQCAQQMKANLRRGDWLGRYGGEEFVIIMPNTSIKEAFVEMERLRVLLSDAQIEMAEEQAPIRITVSVGVASILENTERYEEILTRADSALYQAKRNGRNRVECDSVQERLK